MREIVKCIDLNHDGSSVCKNEAGTFFTEGLLPNEDGLIEITKKGKSFSTGKLIKLLTISPDRVNPVCDKYKECGGCNIMHLSYEKQLDFKLKMVKETLKRIGHLEIDINEIEKMENPYYFRNKVQVPFRSKDGRTICGFFKQKTHDIIQIDKCFIEEKETSNIVIFIRDLMNTLNIKSYDETLKNGSLRHLLIRQNSKKEYMIVLIVNDELPKKEIIVNELIKRFRNITSIILNYNKKNNNTILGDNYKVLYGNEYLKEDLCSLKFRLSHKSFFQTNHYMTEKMYNEIKNILSLNKDNVILDAYSGVGTIGLFLANDVKKVYGIEIIEDAVINARDNASLNGITNSVFLTGKTEEEIKKLKDITFDAIIVDPPRKGLDDSLTKTLLDSNVNKICYVSCNPATLARDLNILSSKYDVKHIKLFDMFPHSCHVECVSLLCLKNTENK